LKFRLAGKGEQTRIGKRLGKYHFCLEHIFIVLNKARIAVIFS